MSPLPSHRIKTLQRDYLYQWQNWGLHPHPGPSLEPRLALCVVTRDKNEVLIVWPGAAHAPIRMKLNSQVFRESTDTCHAKFHPGRSTYRRMSAETPVLLIIEDSHGYGWAWPS